MRFLAHGAITPEAMEAMGRHEQMCHLMTELEGGAEAGEDPAELLPLVQKRQWELVTTDSEFVQGMYEEKVLFSGVVVLILDAEKQVEGVDRLFERYHRLTPRRLYTVTGTRVKVRQLPGAGQAG